MFRIMVQSILQTRSMIFYSLYIIINADIIKNKSDYSIISQFFELLNMVQFLYRTKK